MMGSMLRHGISRGEAVGGGRPEDGDRVTRQPHAREEEPPVIGGLHAAPALTRLARVSAGASSDHEAATA